MSAGSTGKGPVTNSDLHFAYLHFNCKYFRNKLPKDLSTVFTRKLDKIGKLGNTPVILYNETGKLKSPKPVCIQIRWKDRDCKRHAYLTLLHEMVHVENPKPDGHGPWFNKRMKQLAAAGAFNDYW
jgi:hypothetical protein